MALRFVLSDAARRCLLESFSNTNPAWARVNEATNITGRGAATDSWVVKCDKREALTLLSVAERLCPDAVQPIRIAILEEK